MVLPKPTNPHYAILGNVNTQFNRMACFLNSYEKVFQVFKPITRVTGLAAGVLAAQLSWTGRFKYSKGERLFFVFASLAELHQHEGLDLCVYSTSSKKMLSEVLLWLPDIFNMSVAGKYHGTLKQQKLITVLSWSEDCSPSITHTQWRTSGLPPPQAFLITLKDGKLTGGSTVHQRAVI